ncbi:hypothetical protein [Streptomyces sp. NPDC091371]|uniref:hypothetical protein n=1 Tax=Streptomyces sp. NPDC091371 TaxID=3155303 RepID=UPI00341712D4
MARRVLEDEIAQAAVSTALVSWRHESGRDAVCLARLMRPCTGTAAALVLSEIAKNPDDAGIASDFPGAASAAWSALGRAADADPSRLSWFAHHGPFSSHGPTGLDTLTEVTLVFDGARFEGDLAGHTPLEPKAAAGLLDGWQLEPVEGALVRLGRA